MTLHTLDLLVGQWIAKGGALAIFFGMVLESACIPIPSEVILPLAGLMVLTGKLSLTEAVLLSLAGGLVGSYLSYWFGRQGGRAWLERYGKFVGISHRELAHADHFFATRGPITVLTGRLLPIIRTFISLPAGVAQMNMSKFLIYTFIGSVPWTLALIWAGLVLGQNWHIIMGYFSGANVVIGGLMVIAVAAYVWRHKRRSSN